MVFEIRSNCVEMGEVAYRVFYISNITEELSKLQEIKYLRYDLDVACRKEKDQMIQLDSVLSSAEILCDRVKNG